MSTETPLLSVRNLTTTFRTGKGTLTAVEDVSFEVNEGETLCLVGESGSGKTVASESITRLVQSPPGEIQGTIRYRGRDIAEMSEKELRSVRGNNIAHVFQNPQDALNHCYTVGWQIVEAVQMHENVSKQEARERAVDLLGEVGIANPAARFDDYPHEFSGGQKQRVMIAMALVTNPDLLIADEPTTALDVTIQAQILKLLGRLQEEYGMGIIFVTHDLGVVAQIADNVVVMYAGKVMERGSVYEVFEQPSHPYTRALMECLPGGDRSAGGIPGSLPDPTDPPKGCRFAPRCDHAVEECHTGTHPEEQGITDTHSAACVFYRSGRDASTILDAAEEMDTDTGGVADD
jgi:peptide/nickel transport system ATP-binding protein